MRKALEAHYRRIVPGLGVCLSVGLVGVAGSTRSAPKPAFNPKLHDQKTHGSTPAPTRSWTRLTDPFRTGYVHAIVAVAVDSKGVVYVAGRGDVARSTDGGATWTSISFGLPGGVITCLAVNSQGEPVVGVGRDPAVGVFRYTGRRWLQAAGIAASRNISAFTLDSTGALIAVTAWHGDVFRSTDNGSTFTLAASNIGADGALWTVTTAPDGSLYAAGECSQGVYRSSDNGAHWEPLGLSADNGYKGNIFAIGFNAAGEPLVGRSVGDRAVNLQRYTGDRWVPAGAGLPGYRAVMCLTTAPDGEIFACVPDPKIPKSGLYRSADGGKTWTDYSAGLPPGNLVAKLAVDRSGNLYAVSHNAQSEPSALYKSTATP
jgi:photosystem II stability/assembly factor-like uncharacterized protein